MMARQVVAVLLAFLFVLSGVLLPTSAEGGPSTLASHWVPGWGFRDELNRNDTDYQNFWLDNAAKILTTGVITNDMLNANRALGFIQEHITNSFYLPEVVVNSSIIHPKINGAITSLSNRIVLMNENNSAPELQNFSIGDYYAGPWTAGYLGSDRIWYNGEAHRANSSSINRTSGGFTKASYFSFDGLSFYTYLGATVVVGEPYVRVSMQVQPLNSAFGTSDHIYLQVFAGESGKFRQHAFENATLYDEFGNKVRTASISNGSGQAGGGILVAYSNRTNVFDQDSVMLRFNGSGIYDTEHWYRDGAFDNLSWIGLGYDVPYTEAGKMSAPVYADVYPIQHLDSRLLADSVKYATINPLDVAISPPVSFGFVARGLSLASNLSPEDKALRKLATSYWNFMHDRYKGAVPDRTYSRATSVFALAGFELYGGIPTVENFTRKFVGGFDGASIEEHAWAAAALQTLSQYTGSLIDLNVSQSAVSSFAPGGVHFLGLLGSKVKVNDTFEFAETASGLITAGQPYNNSAVIWAMNAVFLSNSSGILLNRPFHGDLANTETIPTILLSEFLFKNSMRSHTGYWVDWVRNANITFIGYHGGHLEISLTGKNGSLGLGTSNGIVTYHGINGTQTIQFPSTPFPWWLVATLAVAVATVLLVVSYLLLRRSRSRKTAL